MPRLIARFNPLGKLSFTHPKISVTNNLNLKLYKVSSYILCVKYKFETDTKRLEDTTQ